MVSSWSVPTVEVRARRQTGDGVVLAHSRRVGLLELMSGLTWEAIPGREKRREEG